jgi:hypothetical protein
VVNRSPRPLGEVRADGMAADNLVEGGHVRIATCSGVTSSKSTRCPVIDSAAISMGTSAAMACPPARHASHL